MLLCWWWNGANSGASTSSTALGTIGAGKSLLVGVYALASRHEQGEILHHDQIEDYWPAVGTENVEGFDEQTNWDSVQLFLAIAQGKNFAETAQEETDLPMAASAAATDLEVAEEIETAAAAGQGTGTAPDAEQEI
ncbi:hypothetical protein HG530_001852 [Fusarium avenaceum]|nr:hypothetical protein HG530_001852 [Fusarium avenaceum]